MRLIILLPGETLLDTAVSKVIAEAADGSFCLLPRHVDCVAALIPGLLIYHDAQGEEHILAMDAGTLVKWGPEVRVSVRRAVQSTDLAALKDTVEQQFKRLDEHESSARSALARLEASVMRRFVEL